MSKRFALATVLLMISAAPALAQTNPQTPPSNPPQSPRTQPPAEPRTQPPAEPRTQKPAEPRTQAAKPAQGVAAADQQFVKNVAGDNMAEVELGRLASEKASREDVKKFAQKMVDEHGKANDELKTLASSKNITLSDTMPASHKAVHDRLAKMSGAAFERSYLREMLNGHRKAVALFKTEAMNGKDSEIKAFATKMQPTIEEHLKEVEGLNRGPVGTTGQRTTPPTTNRPATPPTDRPANPPTSRPATPPSGQPTTPPTRP